MKRRNLCPKRKRTNQQGRLTLARKWLLTFKGKNIVNSYAKWFGVDKLCALKELKILGISIPPDRENAILKGLQIKMERRQAAKLKSLSIEPKDYDTNENFMFIAGYTSGGFAYGVSGEHLDGADGVKMKI